MKRELLLKSRSWKQAEATSKKHQQSVWTAEGSEPNGEHFVDDEDKVRVFCGLRLVQATVAAPTKRESTLTTRIGVAFMQYFCRCCVRAVFLQSKILCDQCTALLLSSIVNYVAYFQHNTGGLRGQ